MNIDKYWCKMSELHTSTPRSGGCADIPDEHLPAALALRPAVRPRGCDIGRQPPLGRQWRINKTKKTQNNKTQECSCYFQLADIPEFQIPNGNTKLI